MTLILGHPDWDSALKMNTCLNRAKEALKQEYLSYVWEDFQDDPLGYGNSTRWNPAAGNVNGAPLAGDEGGGSTIFPTTAVANSQCGLAPANAIGATPWTVATGANGKGFYMEGRMKVSTAVDAVARVFCGFTDDTNTMCLGVFGANSTTLFTVQHSANEITTFNNFSDKAVDTAYHTFRMWGSGRSPTFYAQMDHDGTTPSNIVAFTPTVTYSKLRIHCKAKNLATAADRRLVLDYLLVAVER